MISNHSSPEVTVEDDAQDLNCGGLGGLLTQAKHLQTLKLASSCWPEPPDMDDRPPMLQNAKFLQGYTRPHLKYLGLCGFLMADHEDLMGVFDCHQVTLKSVEMIAVKLLHHDDPQDTICKAWKDLFNGQRCRGIIFHTLSLFLLEDCYTLESHLSQPDDLAYHGEMIR